MVSVLKNEFGQCPFCKKKEAELDGDDVGNGEGCDTFFFVHCKNCNASGPKEQNVNIAVARWDKVS